MKSGRGGIGSHKHYVSGHNSKSPKLRHHMKRMAEADERKSKSGIKEPHASVKDLFKKK